VGLRLDGHGASHRVGALLRAGSIYRFRARSQHVILIPRTGSIDTKGYGTVGAISSGVRGAEGGAEGLEPAGERRMTKREERLLEEVESLKGRLQEVE